MKEFIKILPVLMYLGFIVWMLYLVNKPLKCPKCNSLENYQDNYGTHCKQCRHRISKY